MNLIATDVGRPISDISRKFTDGDLLADAEQVLRDLRPREKEIPTEDGRWWARRVVPYRTVDNRIEGVVLTFNDVTQLKRGEKVLKEANEMLEHQVAERTAQVRERTSHLQAILENAQSGIITMDRGGTIQMVNPAAVQMFGFSAKEMNGMKLAVLLPEVYEIISGDFEAIAGQSPREVSARRQDTSRFPALLGINKFAPDLYSCILLDITRQKELEREVVEIASLEQRRIGQDLHDAVGQELTALHMLARDIADTIKSQPQEALPLAEKMLEGLKRSQQGLRSVLRGLLPVAVDQEGLMAALLDLAERINQEGKVSCTFDCAETVKVADNLVATHLFYIAQEAVRNAIKHGKTRTVRISLKKEETGLVLEIQDEGIGMSGQSMREPGIGLRIMRNRAAIIGGNLTLTSTQPHGTLVTFTLPA